MTNVEMKDKMEETRRVYGDPFYMGRYSVSELLSIVTDVEPEAFEVVQTNLVCESPLDCIYNDPTAIKTNERQKFKLHAVMELAKRMTVEHVSRKIDVIHGPEDAASFIAPRLQNERREHFVALMLNMKNHILAYEEISIGSLNASVVHPREVFAAAIHHGAASLIIAHNHPSGDPSPSREDIAVTQRLVKAGRIMDVPVIDHIIIGDNKFLSLKEKGMLV